MKHFGLLGFPLGHSFSKPWFEARGYRYDNFAFESVDDFFANLPNDIEGFNVTIPHKENIIEHLDELDAAAAQIGAVNCVKVLPDGRLKGYNTDAIGFRETLTAMIGDHFEWQAAVLGSGGASKAVCYVLREMNISHTVISRKNNGYESLKTEQYRLIINTTPLGMFPNTESAPMINYDAITPNHYLYDLVYNPAQTEFLKLGRQKGATVINGLAMLHSQAQAALLHFLEH